MAATHKGLGIVYLERGAYQKALFHYGKAQEMFVAAYGDMHQKVSLIYRRIGTVYQRQGRFEEALAQYEKALEIDTAVHGSDRSELADTLDQMGIVHQKKKGITRRRYFITRRFTRCMWPSSARCT